MTIVLIAIALYLVASGWLVASVQRDDDASRSWLLPANLALLLHGATHYLAWRGSGITDLHFFAALSLAGLGMAILTAIVGASGRMRALGVVVFPLAALTLLAGSRRRPAAVLRLRAPRAQRNEHHRKRHDNPSPATQPTPAYAELAHVGSPIHCSVMATTSVTLAPTDAVSADGTGHASAARSCPRHPRDPRCPC